MNDQFLLELELPELALSLWQSVVMMAATVAGTIAVAWANGAFRHPKEH